MSHSPDPKASPGYDPNAETQPRFNEARLRSLEEVVASGKAHNVTAGAEPVSAEFSLKNVVPREEPTTAGYKSSEIYIRLENKIYGPMPREKLNELLSSGQLTGFESASADLKHWTPLIYHPRMILTETVDPDATHELLHSETDLPQMSAKPHRVDLENLTATSDLPPMDSGPSTPLAAILIKPRKRAGAIVETGPATSPPPSLPVFGDLAVESIESMVRRVDPHVTDSLPGPEHDLTPDLKDFLRQSETGRGDTPSRSYAAGRDAAAASVALASPGSEMTPVAAAVPQSAPAAAGSRISTVLLLIALVALAIYAAWTQQQLREVRRQLQPVPAAPAPAAPAPDKN